MMLTEPFEFPLVSIGLVVEENEYRVGLCLGCTPFCQAFRRGTTVVITATVRPGSGAGRLAAQNNRRGTAKARFGMPVYLETPIATAPPEKISPSHITVSTAIPAHLLHLRSPGLLTRPVTQIFPGQRRLKMASWAIHTNGCNIIISINASRDCSMMIPGISVTARATPILTRFATLRCLDINRHHPPHQGAMKHCHPHLLNPPHPAMASRDAVTSERMQTRPRASFHVPASRFL